jgi:hypothetical protein
MTDTITIDGREYEVTIKSDYDHDAPWIEECGHGPVTDWTRRRKGPSELVLCENRGEKRFYNFAEACRIARRDGWGWIPERVRVEKPIGYRLPTYRCGDFAIVSDDAKEAYAAIYAHFREGKSAKEYAALAAQADYEHLRRWCDGYWQYVGVCVSDGDGRQASCWGIADTDAEDLEEVARELAEEVRAEWLEARQQECLAAYEG